MPRGLGGAGRRGDSTARESNPRDGHPAAVPPDERRLYAMDHPDGS